MTTSNQQSLAGRGSALLAVLWLAAALSAIAFSLANTVRGEVERTSTAVDSLRSYYLAEGGVERGILTILWGLQNQLPPGTAYHYGPDNPVLQFTFPSGDDRVEVIPEASKLNINTSPAEDLFRLMIALGVEPGRAREIVLAIVDWRTPAGFGPFDQFYVSQTPSFRSRHASFEEIEELLVVRGMTPDLFYGGYDRDPAGRFIPRVGVKDCVSVFGATDVFDVNTAQPPVLAAIGLPPEAVAAIVARRRLQPFRNAGELGAFSTAGGSGFGRLRVGGNSIFTIRSTARLRLANGQFSDLRRTVAAMVKYMPDGYDAPLHILRWYDNAWTP